MQKRVFFIHYSHSYTTNFIFHRKHNVTQKGYKGLRTQHMTYVQMVTG